MEPARLMLAHPHLTSRPWGAQRATEVAEQTQRANPRDTGPTRPMLEPTSTTVLAGLQSEQGSSLAWIRTSVL